MVLGLGGGGEDVVVQSLVLHHALLEHISAVVPYALLVNRPQGRAGGARDVPSH